MLCIFYNYKLNCENIIFKLALKFNTHIHMSHEKYRYKFNIIELYVEYRYINNVFIADNSTRVIYAVIINFIKKIKINVYN